MNQKTMAEEANRLMMTYGPFVFQCLSSNAICQRNVIKSVLKCCF